jgi:hypothetical protein
VKLTWLCLDKNCNVLVVINYIAIHDPSFSVEMLIPHVGLINPRTIPGAIFITEKEGEIARV